MTVELVEFEPGKWRVKREELRPARSDLALPYIISDTMEPLEQADGRFYSSKRAYRAAGRALGLIEVGTEKLKPKPKGRVHADKVHQEGRIQSIKKAIARYNSGERSKIPAD